MGRAFLQVSKRSSLQFQLGSSDNSRLGSGNDCAFCVDDHHALSVKSLLGHVTGHSSQDQIGSVNNLFGLGDGYCLFHFSEIPPSPSSNPKVFALMSRAASRTNFSGGKVPVDATRKLKVFAFWS